MKELIENKTGRKEKFSAEYINALGNSTQAKIAKAMNEYPIVISDKQIRDWLVKQVKKDKVNYNIISSLIHEASRCYIRCRKFGWVDVTDFNWYETDFTRYPHLTPECVALKYKEAQSKKLFDSIVVATHEKVVAPITADPLLLGRIVGTDLRFFITQWDSDIILDDLI